jgi:hypothetical protein
MQRSIVANETAANARRQFAQMHKVGAGPAFQDGHGNDISHLVPVLRPAG